MTETPLTNSLSKASSARSGAAAFSTTLWSVVLDAKNPNSPAASDALDALCRSYWYPLYVYVRRRGHSPDEAEDLIQAFFAHVLEKRALQTVNQESDLLQKFCCSG
jgi:RNA polymerase sigma-70 factor (ECF subfamily)